jgi:hypothetical protein
MANPIISMGSQEKAEGMAKVGVWEYEGKLSHGEDYPTMID